MPRIDIIIHAGSFRDAVSSTAEAMRTLQEAVAEAAMRMHEAIRCRCVTHAAVVGDNATEELVDLARADQRAEFEALAACLMPKERIAECWRGARARIGRPHP